MAAVHGHRQVSSHEETTALISIWGENLSVNNFSKEICGLIGHSWAMLFVSAGYPVSVYDSDPIVTGKAIKEIANKFKDLEKSGFLRGKLSASQQIALISAESTLENTVKDAFYIQESVYEDLDIKRQVWSDVDAVIGDNTNVILATSTSAIMPSKISSSLKHRDNFIVSHPFNPPYFVPTVEIVPAPWTKPEVVTKTVSLMKAIGQSTVVCKKEQTGFAIPRMQYAIINECWRLTMDYLSVEDVDTVMTEGLGRRYAFIGPFETAHLNAEGMRNYLDRYNDTIYNCCLDLGPTPSKSGEVAEDIERQLEELTPLNKIEERKSWRDAALAKLNKLRENHDA